MLDCELADTAVTREQDCALVAATDQLEEQMRGIALEGQVAEVIDDQELGFAEMREPLLKPAFAMSFGERATTVVAATNCTECPASIASRPSATATCVLPTPGGPAT
jgi:hypothetical protein